MKKSYIIIFFIFLMLISPLDIKAQNCSSDENRRISSLINNIKITYEHVNNNYFKISIYNIPQELYILAPSQKRLEYNSNNVTTDSNYYGGQSYTFEIYSSNDNQCVNQMNYTKTVYVKKYNIYSEKDICKDEKYKDFNYCNKWYQGTITDSKFENELKRYEEKISNDNETIVQESENNYNDLFKIIILGSIGIAVVIIVMSILIIRKRRRKGL